MSDFTKKSSFCVAPWLHYYRSPGGQRGFCCLADPVKQDNANLTFEETQNSPEFKAARLKMMSGELPSECHLCAKSITTKVYKDELNEDFAHHLDEIRANTSPDGHTSIKPRYLDYRFPTCNLSCLTCNAGFSTRWQQVMRQIDPDFKMPTIDKEFLQGEYKRVLKNYEWERVYYAGGEPLLVPRHLDDLDVLFNQEQQQLKENPKFMLGLFYHTNLQESSEFLESWTLKLNRFRNPNISISLDGVGRFNELVRVGSSFAHTENNLRLLKEKLAPHVTVKLYVVITSVLALTLDQFVDWLLLYRFRVVATMMFGGTMGKIMRIENLRLDHRKKILSDWCRRFDQMQSKDQKILQDFDQLLRAELLAPEFSAEEKHNHLERLERTPFDDVKKELRQLLEPYM